MQITQKAGQAKNTKTDFLALLFLAGERPLVPAAFESGLAAAKRAGDLPQKFRSTLRLYPEGRAQQKRLLLVCCGKRAELDDERLRRLAALAGHHAERAEATGLVVALSKGVWARMDAESGGRALAEGLELGAYTYQPPAKERAKTAKLKRATIQGVESRDSAKFRRGVRRGMLRGRSVGFARELGNRAGNLLTPTMFAAEARKIAGGKVRARVLTEKDMIRLKMGALLGVSKGSREQAKLILFDYKPTNAKKTLCVVGKGLTFDAGGISLKPSGAMDEMRYDMCGGAAVLGLFHALATGAVSSKSRVLGVVPASENLPGGNAQKPGDIVRACDGTTIEVLNTDAEGRLILADALAYATKTFKPDAIVDLATLTGACVVALGHELAAAIGNDQKLVDEVCAAGESSGDRLWQLPMWEVHRAQMKGKFADLKNINAGKSEGAGTIAGASFLSYFVGETPWVHLDIAGAAWGAKAKDYYKSGATGFGVRVLCDWVGRR